MAGIYIHIPFCKTRCSYCDFYSTTDNKLISVYFDTLLSEFELRKNYLSCENIETIYFGGGTPSFIPLQKYHSIFNFIYKNFNLINNPEITIEINPDDISERFLRDLVKLPFNRLSIGLQSTDDNILKLLNRRHSSRNGINSVKIAQEFDFDNISVDLIYGIPGLSPSLWEDSLHQIFNLNIQHLSAYHLTYESGTPLHKLLINNMLTRISDEDSYIQFQLIRNLAIINNFVHYEISNFALDNYFSKHNSNYWKGINYAGFGPSAHSFNSISRQWNISDLYRYLNAVKNNSQFFEIEYLNVKDKFNEYIITSLRTIWGINLTYITSNFESFYSQRFINQLNKYLNSGHLIKIYDDIILSTDGKFISDKIFVDLMA